MITFRELCEKFFTWSELHQSPRSTQFYRECVKPYIKHLGEKAEDPAENMKPYQVNEYISAHPTWSDTYKNVVVGAINRPYNWGCDCGHIEKNPIKKAFKPSTESRKTYAKPEDIDAMLSHLHPDDSFRDFLTFLWHSFSRPQEVRHIEARHVDLANGLIVFPKKESKGKRRERCILLLKTTQPIIERLVKQYPEGKLFRDSRGNPWSKSAVCWRFNALSEKIGKCLTSYTCRHGGINMALEEGKSITDIAAASGHVDATMISRVYSHVHENKDRLRSVFGG